jgi:hypothetical protein
MRYQNELYSLFDYWCCAPPPVLCAYSKGNNRDPTQLDNWKAPKYAWSLSKNSDDRSNNECFFSVWLFHIFWLVMLILSEGTIEAWNVLWLYISFYYGGLVRLYTSDDCRTKSPIIIIGFIYYDCVMREELAEMGDRTSRSLSSKHPPPGARWDSLDTLIIFWKFKCY